MTFGLQAFDGAGGLVLDTSGGIAVVDRVFVSRAVSGVLSSPNYAGCFVFVTTANTDGNQNRVYEPHQVSISGTTITYTKAGMDPYWTQYIDLHAADSYIYVVRGSAAYPHNEVSDGYGLNVFNESGQQIVSRLSDSFQVQEEGIKNHPLAYNAYGTGMMTVNFDRAYLSPPVVALSFIGCGQHATWGSPRSFAVCAGYYLRNASGQFIGQVFYTSASDDTGFPHPASARFKYRVYAPVMDVVTPSPLPDFGLVIYNASGRAVWDSSKKNLKPVENAPTNEWLIASAAVPSDYDYDYSGANDADNYLIGLTYAPDYTWNGSTWVVGEYRWREGEIYLTETDDSNHLVAGPPIRAMTVPA